MNTVFGWCWRQYRWTFLHKSVMQNTKYIRICVIIITIFKVILPTTSVTCCVYYNIPRLAFLKRSLVQVKLCMGSPKSLIQFYLCMSRKCFICGSWFLEPFLNFTTSFLLEEGILLLCQNSYTSSLIASINFISERGSLPMKAQISIWQPVSRLSRLIEYFRRVFTLHLMRLDFSLSKLCRLVILLTIDSKKTRRAALRSLEQVFWPIFWKASTRFLTIWLLVS